MLDANVEQIECSDHVGLNVELGRFIRALRGRRADAVNYCVESSRNQFIQRTDVTKVACIELDPLRRSSKPLGVKIINADVVLFREELVDDMRSQKTRTPEIGR